MNHVFLCHTVYLKQRHFCQFQVCQIFNPRSLHQRRRSCCGAAWGSRTLSMDSCVCPHTSRQPCQTSSGPSRTLWEAHQGDEDPGLELGCWPFGLRKRLRLLGFCLLCFGVPLCWIGQPTLLQVVTLLLKTYLKPLPLVWRLSWTTRLNQLCRRR